MKCEHTGLRMAFGVIVTKDNRRLCTSCALDEPLEELVSADGTGAARQLQSRREADNESRGV
jgi:hypothetical protein